MVLTEEQIGHLPDVSNKLGGSYRRLNAVEIAQWRVYEKGQYLLRFVAGKAVVDGINCLIADDSRKEDGSLVRHGIHTIDSLFEYSTILKLK